MASPAANTVNPALLGAKLGALVRDIGIADAPTAEGGGGAAVLNHNGVGYVIAAPAMGVRSLGPALLWAAKNDLDEVVLFTDDHGGDLARRATLFPAIATVVRVVQQASSQPATAQLLEGPPPLDERVLELGDAFAGAGAIPVDDFGRLVGEVHGLEVARAFLNEADELVVEVGVGQADRELHELVHSNLATVDAVTRAAEMVNGFRSPEAEPHPLNRVGRARWLRSVAVADADLIGVGELAPVPPLRWRDTVLGIEPACAVSDSAVVVFSAGVDPDLVPEALDYRNREAPGAELVIVMAARDALPTVVRLIESCPNTRLKTVSPPWS